jgi:hypothetical protein
VQPTQVLAGLVALAFLVLGIVGMTQTGFNDFAGHDHATLLGFAINPLHNLVHIVFGVVGLLLVLSSVTARLYGWILLVGYGVVLVWGLMLVGVTSSNPVSELGNPLNLNVADNWLHLGIAVLGLIIAVAPARRRIVVEEPVVEREPVTEPVPAQKVETAQKSDTTQKVDTTSTDTTTTEEKTDAKPRGLHRLSRLRDRSAH